jgi:hypothetical protein
MLADWANRQMLTCAPQRRPLGVVELKQLPEAARIGERELGGAGSASEQGKLVEVSDFTKRLANELDNRPDCRHNHMLDAGACHYPFVRHGA